MTERTQAWEAARERLERVRYEAGMVEMLDRLHKFGEGAMRTGLFRPPFVPYTELLDFIKRELTELRRAK